jgi:hypothetical protein
MKISEDLHPHQYPPPPQDNFMWLEDHPMASRQVAASYMKDFRRQLKTTQKERVLVYTPFGLQNLCCLSQLASTYLVYALSFFR